MSRPVIEPSLICAPGAALAGQALLVAALPLTQHLMRMALGHTLPEGRDQVHALLRDDRLFVRALTLYLALGSGAREYDLNWAGAASDMSEDWLIDRVKSVALEAMEPHEVGALEQARWQVDHLGPSAASG